MLTASAGVALFGEPITARLALASVLVLGGIALAIRAQSHTAAAVGSGSRVIKNESPFVRVRWVSEWTRHRGRNFSGRRRRLISGYVTFPWKSRAERCTVAR